MADGRQIADVDRPASAVGGVRLQEIKGDLYVIPDEAVALLGANKLDRRLFNVTDLIEIGYDDAKSSGVPLIATYPAAQARAAVEPKAPRGSKLTRKLTGIRAAALSADKKQARTFWTTVAPQGSATGGQGGSVLGAGVAKLWLDGRVKVNLKESVPLIGAPQAWQRGYPLELSAAGPDGQQVAELPGCGPTALDRRILALMLSGLTDQAVATQLDLSLRTLQRRLRYLMDFAGVDTRLQLGWHAARNSWA
jgi:hypothetical protein